MIVPTRHWRMRWSTATDRDLVDAVEADVLAFTGGPPADDITVLALRATDLAGRAQ